MLLKLHKFEPFGSMSVSDIVINTQKISHIENEGTFTPEQINFLKEALPKEYGDLEGGQFATIYYSRNQGDCISVVESLDRIYRMYDDNMYCYLS